MDAHHGDGVQAAFATDQRVFTLSIHEAGRWPMSDREAAGRVTDRAGGLARNLPVPAGLNDSEMAYLVTAAVLPLAEAFGPQAVVLQCGVVARVTTGRGRSARSSHPMRA